jgi:hypothetical protein
MSDFDFLLRIETFRKALKEQRSVLAEFWEKGRRVLAASGIELKPMPRKWTTFRRNYFSVLFIAVFYLLEVPPPRLRLYARLNHCMRTWVTACDNLLDGELKEMLLTDLPEEARIFKSVHTLLLADRIFFSFLLDAVREGTITGEEMELLLRVSLTSLTPSGIEEAGEEAGVDYSALPPGDVLHKVHLAKTGLLFTSPLKAPLALGDIKSLKGAEYLSGGLCHFGLGCQILDDINDLGMDLLQRRHNYLASLVMHGRDAGERQALMGLMKGGGDPALMKEPSLYQRFPAAFRAAQKELQGQFRLALDLLCRGGLPLNTSQRQAFLGALLVLFRHPALLSRLRQQ